MNKMTGGLIAVGAMVAGIGYLAGSLRFGAVQPPPVVAQARVSGALMEDTRWRVAADATPDCWIIQDVRGDPTFRTCMDVAPRTARITGPTATSTSQPTPTSQPTAPPVNVNPDMERGVILPDGWDFRQLYGNPDGEWSSTVYRSPSRSLAIMATTSASAQEGEWWQAGISVAPGAVYVVEYAIYASHPDTYSYISVEWISAGNAYISASMTPVQRSPGPGWATYSTTVTAPAGAATATMRLRGVLPNISGALKAWDDVKLR